LSDVKEHDLSVTEQSKVSEENVSSNKVVEGGGDTIRRRQGY
jgi:hypothetical protein